MSHRPPSRGPGVAVSERTFRVLNQQGVRRSEEVAMPRNVPWSFVETFRAQAEYNHGQTLERLNERGGLAPEEMWLAAHGKRLFRDGEPPSTQGAVDWLNGELAKLRDLPPEPTTEPNPSATREKETTDGR